MSYLANIKQSCFVDGVLSMPLNLLECGVPQVGYERNQNLKALTKNLPGIRLLVLVLGLRKFQIPGRYSVIRFTISAQFQIEFTNWT